MDEFKVVRAVNGWIVSYIEKDKSAHVQEVFTGGDRLEERLGKLIYAMDAPKERE